MDHRVRSTDVLLGLLLVLVASLTFLFLNNRFEGPADPADLVSGAKQLTAQFADTKKLPTKQPVLFKGVRIGRVNKVVWQPREKVAKVTFTIDRGFRVYEDAVIRIGERSLLGDPFLDLVTRGSRDRRELGGGDEIRDVRVSVNFDEALDFLDAKGRRHVRGLLGSIARGVSPDGNGERLNGTVGAAAATVTEMTKLTRTLRGQEDQIARLVSSASSVLGVIGEREQAVRTIVGSGRVTLDALGANASALKRGVDELPRVLASSRRALAATGPLVADARPVVRRLRDLSPDLAAALDARGARSLRAISGDLRSTIRGLPRLREVVEPVLGKELRPLLMSLGPLVAAVGPVSRSLLPALTYLTAGEAGKSRVEAIAGLYALLGSATKGTAGARGHYVRAGFALEPAELTDQPDDRCPTRGYCNNAYPKPGDALDPQPFTGDYPRILPCTVPPRTAPTKPCK